MKKYLFSIAIIMVIIGTIGTYLTKDELYIPSSNSLDRMEPLITKQFSTEEIDNLVVDLNTESLEIRTSDINHIQVDVKTKKSKEKNLPLQITQVNNELKITSDESKSRFFLLRELTSRTKVIVTVPKDNRLEQVLIETKVGEIDIVNIKSKFIKSYTDVGTIGLTNVDTDNLETKSDVGVIDLNNVTGAIEAETEVGRIKLTTGDLLNDVSLESSVGSIDVAFTEYPVQTRIEANTDVGSVRIFGENRRIHGDGTKQFILEVTTEVGRIQVEEE